MNWFHWAMVGESLPTSVARMGLMMANPDEYDLFEMVFGFERLVKQLESLVTNGSETKLMAK